VTRTPTTETCNAIDDNCDGVVDNGPTSTCGAPSETLTVNVGNTFTRTAFVAAPSGSELWYRVDFPPNYSPNLRGAGVPRIRFTSSDPST
jgi:hypothetical protein